MFEKKINILIKNFNLYVKNFKQIDIDVGRDHGQDEFLFHMKLIYTMDTSVSYIYFRKDIGTIFKNAIIMKLGESFKNTISYFI